jgi:hypothetical protein
LVDEAFVLELDFAPSAGLRLVAESVEFYVGDVDGLSEQLPNYIEDDDAEIRANLADWRSSFVPLWANILDRTSS